MLFANGNLLIIREHPSDRTHDESVPETSNRLRWLRWLDYVPNTNPNVPTLTLIYTDGWNSGSQLKGQHTCEGANRVRLQPCYSTRWTKKKRSCTRHKRLTRSEDLRWARSLTPFNKLATSFSHFSLRIHQRILPP